MRDKSFHKTKYKVLARTTC